MPTYEYQCDKCGHRFEIWQKITEASLTHCPENECGGSIQRLISAESSFILKGTGWYATDYKKASIRPKGEESPSSTVQKESKTAPTPSIAKTKEGAQ